MRQLSFLCCWIHVEWWSWEKGWWWMSIDWRRTRHHFDVRWSRVWTTLLSSLRGKESYHDVIKLTIKWIRRRSTRTFSKLRSTRFPDGDKSTLTANQAKNNTFLASIRTHQQTTCFCSTPSTTTTTERIDENEGKSKECSFSFYMELLVFFTDTFLFSLCLCVL